jgi:hypothetical protein
MVSSHVAGPVYRDGSGSVGLTSCPPNRQQLNPSIDIESDALGDP